MSKREIEERYLESSLAENAVQLLTGDSDPAKDFAYANFIIDNGLFLRRLKKTLRVRLVDARESDVQRVLAAEEYHRLAILFALHPALSRFEFTLKIPSTDNHGKDEVEDIGAIAQHLNLGDKIDSPAKLNATLTDAGFVICSSVFTKRQQWNLGALNEHTQLAVTRDSSRCCHHLIDGDTARKVVEVEALVTIPDRSSAREKTRISDRAQKDLDQWIRSKIGEPPRSVLGTATACIMAHAPRLAREMLTSSVVKRKDLDQMLANNELSREQYQAILAIG